MIDGHGPSQCVNRAFGGAVGGHTGVGNEAVIGPDVDDAGAFGPPEHRQGRFGHEERTGHIDAETSEEDFDTASDLNFKAVFFTVQAALPYLADGASVIVTGNALTSVPVIGPSVAIAAKAAVKALARTFAVELAPRGIRVNVLSPGPTATAAPTSGETPDDMTVQITKQIPLGRWGSPEDVAKAAVFLASEDSSHVTGADLHVGGGIGMGWVPPIDPLTQIPQPGSAPAS